MKKEKTEEKEEKTKKNAKREKIIKEDFEKQDLKKFDESFRKIVLGVDEAGRGPLAGPVVASAVIIKNNFDEIMEINNSKKLTEKKRERLYKAIISNCVVGVGIASETEIDEINILNATFLAMRRAIDEVNKIADFDIVLVDGNHKIRKFSGEQECIVKGDATSLAIAAASIVAKVTRDKMMCEIAKEFPKYGFEKHKGYGTKAHREILFKIGACKYHRKTFLKKILGN